MSAPQTAARLWNRRQLVRLFSAGGMAFALEGRAQFTLGIGTYTFRSLDIDGLIERCRQLGLRAMELSHPQYMLPQAKLETFSPAREKLRAGGIDLVSWYCGHLSKRSEIGSLAEGVRLFGVKTVSGSAERELLDEIDGACGKSGFAFGIHNHYFANRKFTYESPEDVLSAVKGRANIFATLDTGHMIAVGVDPTEAYRKLKAHVRIIHLKDEDTPGHGVVMGKGKGNMAQFLYTILREGFQGLGAIEFEEGKDPVREVAECVSFIRNQMRRERS